MKEEYKLQDSRMVKTVNLRTISYHYEHHHEVKEQKGNELNEGH